MSKAEQIKISDLKRILIKLQNKQLEFDFFGITSNGTDCLYFVQDGQTYAIEFEVIKEDQKKWLNNLKEYAQQNNYRILMTTYKNKADYPSAEPAPVLRIETKSDLDQTAIIGQNMMTKVFGNDQATIYEVVP